MIKICIGNYRICRRECYASFDTNNGRMTCQIHQESSVRYEINYISYKEYNYSDMSYQVKFVVKTHTHYKIFLNFYFIMLDRDD